MVHCFPAHPPVKTRNRRRKTVFISPLPSFDALVLNPVHLAPDKPANFSVLIQEGRNAVAGLMPAALLNVQFLTNGQVTPSTKAS